MTEHFHVVRVTEHRIKCSDHCLSDGPHLDEYRAMDKDPGRPSFTERLQHAAERQLTTGWPPEPTDMFADEQGQIR